MPPRSSVKARHVLMAIHPPVSSVPLVTSEHRSIWHFRTRGSHPVPCFSHIFTDSVSKALFSAARNASRLDVSHPHISFYSRTSPVLPKGSVVGGRSVHSALAYSESQISQKTHKVIHEIATLKISSDGASIANNVALAPTPVQP